MQTEECNNKFSKLRGDLSFLNASMPLYQIFTAFANLRLSDWSISFKAKLWLRNIHTNNTPAFETNEIMCLIFL